MRLPLIAPSELSPDQRALYDDMRKGIAADFHEFCAMRADGALTGPWNPWLHEPRIGKPAWELAKSLASQSALPESVRQVAILVTGARFRAGYQIYAHTLVARHEGLAETKLATIVAGQRPTDLTREEAIAYDVASALVTGGILPELTYRTAIKAFGEHGAAELCYLVGLYCFVSITLNYFDVPVPDLGLRA